MNKSAKRKATLTDLRGPSTLRSGLVSKLDCGGLDELEPCELLGAGKYGVVHKMMEKSTGQLRVVKTVERPAGWDDKQLKLEAEILQNLDHPHILRIFSWYEDGDAVNIVMEHCEGGELMKVVKEGRARGQLLPEMWAATCIRQCFEALVYLHAKGIVHKDLKSANILLLQNTESQGKVFLSFPHVVICDLGLAEVCSRGIFGSGMGGGRAKRVAGTPVTMAPEVWKGSFGPKSDVWSMGVVMFEMVSGKIPFQPERNEQAMWAALHRQGPDWQAFEASKEALRLCEWLLTVKESNRPTAAEALEHVWLKNKGRQKLSDKEIDDLVKAVRTWKTRNAMQRALSLKMAAGCTCLKQFAVLFSQFDTDNSGILDQAELLPALTSLGLEPSLAKEIAASLDVNNDGSCEFVEFAAACLSSLEEEFDELLRQEFNALDIKRKGWLNDDQMEPLINELRPLALAHGLQLEDLDANGDGVISFSEFCEYFGRPGALYENEGKHQNKTRRLERIKQLPMKQHIRIIREEGLEDFQSAMQASMELSFQASMEFSPEKPTEPADQVTDRILLRMKQHSAKTKSHTQSQSKAEQSTQAQTEELNEDAGTEDAAIEAANYSVECVMSSTRNDLQASLCADSERSVMSPIIVGQVSQCSKMSETHESCMGCWLVDGLKWLGIKGQFDLACSRGVAVIAL